MSAALAELETLPTVQAYRFELDPNDKQRTQLAKNVGTSRFAYNWGLAEVGSSSTSPAGTARSFSSRPPSTRRP